MQSPCRAAACAVTTTRVARRTTGLRLRTFGARPEPLLKPRGSCGAVDQEIQWNQRIHWGLLSYRTEIGRSWRAASARRPNGGRLADTARDIQQPFPATGCFRDRHWFGDESWGMHTPSPLRSRGAALVARPLQQRCAYCPRDVLHDGLSTGSLWPGIQSPLPAAESSLVSERRGRRVMGGMPCVSKREIGICREQKGFLAVGG